MNCRCAADANGAVPVDATSYDVRVWSTEPGRVVVRAACRACGVVWFVEEDDSWHQPVRFWRPHPPG